MGNLPNTAVSGPQIPTDVTNPDGSSVYPVPTPFITGNEIYLTNPFMNFMSLPNYNLTIAFQCNGDAYNTPMGGLYFTISDTGYNTFFRLERFNTMQSYTLYNINPLNGAVIAKVVTFATTGVTVTGGTPAGGTAIQIPIPPLQVLSGAGSPLSVTPNTNFFIMLTYNSSSKVCNIYYYKGNNTAVSPPPSTPSLTNPSSTYTVQSPSSSPIISNVIPSVISQSNVYMPPFIPANFTMGGGISQYTPSIQMLSQFLWGGAISNIVIANDLLTWNQVWNLPFQTATS